MVNCQCLDIAFDYSNWHLLLKDKTIVILVKKKCIFHSPAVKNTLYWYLTFSGRVIVKFRGVGMKSRLFEKKQIVEFF